MVSLAHAGQCSTGRTIPTQEINVMTDYSSGTVAIEIKVNTVTFQTMKSRDPMQQEEAKRIIMSEMTKQFRKTTAAQIPSENIPLCLHYYLKGVLDLIIREASDGSLRIIVECSTLEVLERLWKDYRSGNLNTVAEKCLLTDDIKWWFDVESVQLKTIILEEDYLACKLFLTDISRVNRDATVKDDELLPQSQTQDADETQTQTTEEPKPMTVQLAVNSEASINPPLQIDAFSAHSFYEDLKNSTAITCLDLRGKKIDDNGARSLSEVLKVNTTLTNLDVSENYIGDDGVRSLSEKLSCNTTLTNLNVSKNYIGDDGVRSLSHITTLTDLNVSKNYIGDRGARSLSSALEHNATLTNLNVSKNYIGDRGANSLSEGLKGNTTLTRLDLSKNYIGGDGVRSLFEVLNVKCDWPHLDPGKKYIFDSGAHSHSAILKTNTTLTYLNLSGNYISDDWTSLFWDLKVTNTTSNLVLKKANDDWRVCSFSGMRKERATWKPKEKEIIDITAGEMKDAEKSFNPTLDIMALKINTTLTYVDLGGKNIGDHGARSLSEVLKVNATLTYLDVSENNIGPRGTDSIFEALKHNATLTNLNVSNNNIGEDGAYSLFRALEHNTTLTNLDVSNNNIGEDGAFLLFRALRHNTTLTNLDVSNNNIGKDGAYLLFRALRHNTTLTNLDVSNNNIGKDGAYLLFRALRHNTTLTNLDVSNNNIGKDGAYLLFRALEHNTTLTDLNVGKNNIGEHGADSLSSALKHNATITNLDVSKNNIGADGARSLSNTLRHNATLTSLDVSKNNIGSKGAETLFEALKLNTALTNLNVSKNNIGPDGAKSLSRALEHNATLTHLDVSNNNADVEARSISEILKKRTISRRNKPERREITALDPSEMKDVSRRHEIQTSKHLTETKSLDESEEEQSKMTPVRTALPDGAMETESMDQIVSSLDRLGIESESFSENRMEAESCAESEKNPVLRGKAGDVINGATVETRCEVSEKGGIWKLQDIQAAACITFPQNAVTNPVLFKCTIWECTTNFPPLEKDEALVSSVIVLTCDDPLSANFTGDFDKEVTVTLSHCATNLKGYEVVIRELVDPENNNWRDLETTNIWQASADIQQDPSSKPRVPFAEAKVTCCSAFAVICRLRTYTFSTNAQGKCDFTCKVQDYPDVSVTIPASVVHENMDFLLTVKVQEIPQQWYDDSGIIAGPVLHITCSPAIQLGEPATITIPISMQADKVVSAEFSSKNVRVLVNTDEESSDWKEITDQLPRPADLSNGVVTFQTTHFTRFSALLEMIPILNLQSRAPHLTKHVPLEAGFFACLCNSGCPGKFQLRFYCYPIHIESQVRTNVCSTYQVFRYGSGDSNEPLCQDDVIFVTLRKGLELSEDTSEDELQLRFRADKKFENDVVVRDPCGNVPQIEFFKHLDEKPPRKKKLCKLSIVPPQEEHSITMQSETTPIQTERGKPTKRKRASSRGQRPYISLTETTQSKQRKVAFPFEQKELTTPAQTVKQDTPMDDELEELGEKIAKNWKKLGRRLGISEPKLQEIHEAHDQLSEKGYYMLKYWKQEKGSAATYQALRDALQHKLVQRQDLAEQFCFIDDMER
ncbi:uncharacterized protein LOC144652233 isoform X3 [Oculina patagonica]